MEIPDLYRALNLELQMVGPNEASIRGRASIREGFYYRKYDIYFIRKSDDENKLKSVDGK